MFDEATELDFVVWFQGRGDWLDTPMGLFSQLGHPLVLVVILAVIFWCIDSGLGQRMALFVFFAGSVNEILKRLFSAPRPFWVSGEVRAIGEGSTAFGMPSGHSVVAPMWLLVGFVSKRRWVWAATGSVAVMIGLSRIYLGAHFPSQVAVGWIVGGLLLIGFRIFEAPFLSWFTPKPTVQQLSVVAAVTVALIGGGALSAAALDDFTPELSWERNAEGQIDETEPFDPVDTNDIAATGGIFAGTATGLVLLAARGGFRTSGPLRQRVLRFGVGLVCVIVMLASSGLLSSLADFEDRGGSVALIWEFAVPFVTGLVIFFVAPVLFQYLRLAEPAGRREPAGTTL